MKKIIAKIDKMHCSSCSIRIDGDLEELDGILKSETSYIKAVSNIMYDETKLDESQIKKTIKDAGYEVTEIKEYE